MVAAKAETSVGTLQYHFPSKDALYTACIESVYEPMSELLAESYALTELPMAEALRHATIEGFRFVRRYQINLRLIYREIFDRGALHPSIPSRLGGPALQMGAAVIAARHGGTPTDYMMGLESAVIVIIRYALMTEEELRTFFSIEGDPWPEVEAYLANMLPKMILMGRADDA